MPVTFHVQEVAANVNNAAVNFKGPDKTAIWIAACGLSVKVNFTASLFRASENYLPLI